MTATSTPADLRREAIVEHVTADGYVAVSDLARIHGVTEMTIRRDITALAATGHLRRVHGGVSHPGGTPYQDRLSRGGDVKQAVARRAAALLSPGLTVGFDSGTTVAATVDHLPAGLTAVTHSVPLLAHLAERPDVTTIGLGGTLHHETLSFSGSTVHDALERLRLDVALLSVTSLSRDGLTCATAHDAETKRTMIARSRRVVVLADASKITSGGGVVVAGLEAVHTVVTDPGLDPAARLLLEDSGIEVLEADL